MNELLGFIVLTMPLFFFVIWVPVSIALAYFFSRNFIKKSFSLKIIGGLLIFLFFLLFPISDEIAGRIYFNQICKTEGDVKVYKTISLPAEYWNEDGSPNFYDPSNGNFTLPENKFYNAKAKDVSHLFGVEELHTFIFDINTNYLLGEKSWFLYWGGYIRRNFTPHNTANSCGGDWDEFIEKQFSRNNS